MSRAPLWRPTAPLDADAAADGREAHAPPAAPTVASNAPRAMIPRRSVAPLPARSAVDASAALARLGALLAEAAGILQELSRVPLAVQAERALMCSVAEPNTPARLMSVRDVAQKLSLSERTVRRLRRRGVLPAGIEVSGVIRWRPEEIDAWLAQGGSR